MKNILAKLTDYKELSYDEAKETLNKIASGSFTEVEIAAFLTTFLMRGINLNELDGFRDALLELCIPVNLSDFDAVDLCGTGGDGKNTFNISTLASFVVAGAGYKVAKHGNYGVSSSCGSSNVLEYFGYKFTNNTDVLKRNIAEAGICFLHAPLFHPAMKNVAPVRRQLKLKTIFNLLGPLVNPAQPQRQLTGVYSPEIARLYNYSLARTTKQYAIVHSLSGYDEISLTSDALLQTNENQQIVSPSYFGFKQIEEQALAAGNSVDEAAEIFLQVLENKGTAAQNSAVLANAGLAIQLFKPETSVTDCIAEAQIALESGRALESFKKLLAGA